MLDPAVWFDHGQVGDLGSGIVWVGAAVVEPMAPWRGLIECIRVG